MGWILLAAFTIIPMAEVFVLLQVGSLLGAFNTFLIVLLTGVTGAWLARHEGAGVLMKLREDAGRGIPPGPSIAEGVLVFMGGVLLLTPGILTDVMGLLFLFPWSRRWLARRLSAAVAARITVAGTGNPDEPANPYARSRQAPRPREVEAQNPFSNPFDDLP